MTAVSPEWAFAPFDACSTRQRDIGRVHRASLLGLRVVTEFPKYLPQLLSPTQKRELNDTLRTMGQSIENIAKAAEKSKVDIRRDVPFVNSNAVVSLWSALEVGIEDFLIAWMMNQPGALRVPALRKIKIALAEYDALDREGRMRVLLKELESSVIGKQGVDCFEPLLDTFGLSGKVGKPIKEAIYEMQHVRNVIVHRGGHADRRFVEALPDSGVKLGQPLKVMAKQCWDYRSAVRGYVLTVAERVATCLGTTNSPELAQLRSSLHP